MPLCILFHIFQTKNPLDSEHGIFVAVYYQPLFSKENTSILNSQQFFGLFIEKLKESNLQLSVYHTKAMCKFHATDIFLDLVTIFMELFEYSNQHDVLQLFSLKSFSFLKKTNQFIYLLQEYYLVREDKFDFLRFLARLFFKYVSLSHFNFSFLIYP